MKTVSVILEHRTLSDMVAHVAETYQKMSAVNGVNGDQVTIEPDVPAMGFVTITAVDQKQGDDTWDE